MTLTNKLKSFMEDLASDPVEERVIEYVIREMQNGRRLTEVLHDPYVKNRLSDERLAHVIENPDVAMTLEQEITAAFERREFGFTD